MGKVTLPKGFDPVEIKHWYLVANRASALIYEGNLDGIFRYVKRIKNSKGKLMDAQIGNDRPGISFSSSRSEMLHGFEAHSSPHEVIAENFARRIAKMLDKAVLGRECSDLVVIAEPHFLGLLNKELPKRVQTLVRRSVPKEWSQGSDQELKEYLREKLT